MVKAAWPEASSFRADLRGPIEEITVPVGVLCPGSAVTVAVKVTDWPKTLGLAEEVTVVVVSAGLTTWSSTADVLLLNAGRTRVDGGDRVGRCQDVQGAGAEGGDAGGSRKCNEGFVADDGGAVLEVNGPSRGCFEIVGIGRGGHGGGEGDRLAEDAGVGGGGGGQGGGGKDDPDFKPLDRGTEERSPG